MPELPEVETTCAGVRPHLVDTHVVNVDVREHRLRWLVAPEVEQLTNAKINKVTRRAKYILIHFDHGVLISHLGMSGSLRICEPEMELRKHDHLVFQLSSGKQMRYHDPRRFGCALWSQHPLQHKLLASLGPEPLSNEFTADYLYEKARASQASIKQFIMNNKIVVGVGNIYACESLFLSGISPKRAAGSISRKRISTFHQNIRTVLAKAIKQGGTTLRDFVNQDGNPGYFQQQLFTYDRERQPCKTCEGSIKRIVQGQRSTFYCPACQR